MFPSTNWITHTKIINAISLKGSSMCEKRIITPDGIAPIKGPKKGITLVIPQIKAIRAAKSTSRIERKIK